MKYLKKTTINTATKSYPVFIGTDIIKSLPELAKEFNLPKRVFIIIDKNVELLYGAFIKKVISSFASKIYFLSLSSSERIKSFNTVAKIFTRLFEEKFSRDTLVVAIGGGTIGDVAGFAASTYMRGVPLVHVPTTLLSVVDSSLGGKNAINFKEVKNLVGTFYQPSFVISDTRFFESLPQKELISGLGEVIKYSYLTDGKFYSDLLSNNNLLLNKDSGYLRKVVYECIKIKSAVVSKDEKEISGVRKILNFGHTFAHAFESNSSYRLNHGQAVMAGIICALFLSFKKGLINKKQLDYMINLPIRFKSSIHLKKINANEIIRLMAYDKKSRGSKTNFVLIKNFGEIVIDMNADKKEIQWALNETRKLSV
ncbi:MAG: 3-dehydroquinate synthase [Ignavibacteriaceae bacterium]|nr:3-dehydroquinate synthase [Ignavibacteriaceae bacterium]MCW8996065.1 3-dehydroquinate synthase [Psychromonas sp.]MCW9094885.1 3-dehydroquinate synthase [Ignavibacteriaceae bacterium]MCW9098608.1 3-dehydroquinate synthase [Ignavibacteriaceae bacterium]